MISETINTVVNNVTDRLGEVIEFIKPAIEAVNTVSITVVQETTLAGFAYVVLGIIAIILSILFILCSIQASRLSGRAKEVEDKGEQSRNECVSGWMIALGITSCVIGIACILANLGCWLAPTREVLREVVLHI